MLGVRGREGVGRWVPREEEQEVRPTEWFYDLRRLAGRDHWYLLGQKLTDRERATTGLDKVQSANLGPRRAGQLGRAGEVERLAH